MNKCYRMRARLLRRNVLRFCRALSLIKLLAMKGFQLNFTSNSGRLLVNLLLTVPMSVLLKAKCRAHRNSLTLIEKKGKDRSFLENWRPISLVNVDSKIISKVLATRIKKCPSKYHPPQPEWLRERPLHRRNCSIDFGSNGVFPQRKYSRFNDLY